MQGDPRDMKLDHCPKCGGPVCPHCGKSPHSNHSLNTALPVPYWYLPPHFYGPFDELITTCTTEEA